MAMVEDQGQSQSIVPDGKDGPLLGTRIVEERMVSPVPSQTGGQQSGQRRDDPGSQPAMPASGLWDHHA
jgi:hypothetical protein